MHRLYYRLPLLSCTNTQLFIYVLGAGTFISPRIFILVIVKVKRPSANIAQLDQKLSWKESPLQFKV